MTYFWPAFTVVYAIALVGLILLGIGDDLAIALGVVGGLLTNVAITMTKVRRHV